MKNIVIVKLLTCSTSTAKSNVINPVGVMLH